MNFKTRSEIAQEIAFETGQTIFPQTDWAGIPSHLSIGGLGALRYQEERAETFLREDIALARFHYRMTSTLSPDVAIAMTLPKAFTLVL